MNYPKPPKAYNNKSFLNSAAARNIRVQCELTEPRERFIQNHVQHTVVMFGSARLVDEAHAQALMKEAEEAMRRAPEAPESIKLLQTARMRVKAAPYYEMARKIAADLANWSKMLPRQKQFHICTGGGPGIMEAGNRGARESGSESLAFGISLPFEQHINPYVSEDLALEFHYFFVRKFWFFYMAKALLAFPGGFGTMDELFEVLTLIQTRKYHKHVPIILVGKAFWDDILNFDAFVEWGVISPDDLHLFKVVDSAEDAVAALKADFEAHFLLAEEPTDRNHWLLEPDYPVEM